MGLPVRCSRATANLHRLFCVVHHCKHCTELLAQLCGVVGFQGTTSCRQCLNGQHWYVPYRIYCVFVMLWLTGRQVTGLSRMCRPRQREEPISASTKQVRMLLPPNQLYKLILGCPSVRNFSIAVGPVLGGVLANFLGFRSIFVFLLGLSIFALAVIVIFLPETMRSIAGDGSLRLGGIYKPFIYRLKKEPQYMRDPDTAVKRKAVTLGTFVEPLRLLTRKDILLNLIFGGVIYTIWSMVTASTTGLFKLNFGLSEILLGLAFLPNGTFQISHQFQPPSS